MRSLPGVACPPVPRNSGGNGRRRPPATSTLRRCCCAMHRLKPLHFDTRAVPSRQASADEPVPRRSGCTRAHLPTTSPGTVGNSTALAGDQDTAAHKHSKHAPGSQALDPRPRHMQAAPCTPSAKRRLAHARASGCGAPPAKQRCRYPARRPRTRRAPRSSAARAACAASGVVVQARLLLALHLDDALVEVLVVYLRGRVH
jgi:hypothetical protein